MRIRKKPWAVPELLACPYFIQQPESMKGHWREFFEKKQPLMLELGCGKGSFIAAIAHQHPDINFIAVDIKSDMLGYARRALSFAFKGDDNVKNAALTAYNIEQICEILSPQDEIDRIYINFCNPWPKGKHRKKRLTHTRQLDKYKTFLKKGAQIHFKTDDMDLFRCTFSYLEESCGWKVLYSTENLYESEYEDNIPTEHERMFSSQGIPIKFMIVQYCPKDNTVLRTTDYIQP